MARVESSTTAGEGRASGWETWRVSGSDQIHWFAFGPKGSTQGVGGSEEEAQRLARNAEEGLR